MKKRVKLITSLLLLAVMLFVVSCSGGPAVTSSPGASDSTEKNTSEPTEPVGEGPYWVGDLELSLWCSFDGKGFDNISSFEEIWCYQELERLTGVDINWLHPPVGQESEQFNLIVGSGDYPDLMYYSVGSAYPGGALKAIQDKVIVDLTPYITPEKSPYISALYDQYPRYRINSMTDDGGFYMYPRVDGYALIPEYDYFCIYNGFQYRADWAEKLGFDKPDTVDEWHDLGVAIRDGDPNGNGQTDEIPIVAQGNLQYWMCPFGIQWGSNGFYMDGSQLNYTVLSPKYKDFLATMSQWYSEGLIDPDYLATDGTMFKNKIVSNLGGITIGGIGGNFGGITQALMQEYGDTAVWGTTPWPLAVDGSGKRYHRCTAPATFEMGSGLYIFTKNKNIDLTAQWCDVNFAPDIIEMLNFGELGVTYTKDAEGAIEIVPEFKEKMLAATDANTVICEIAQAAMNSWGTMIHPEYYKIQWVIPGQFEAAVDWNVDRADDLLVPPITHTAEEGARYSNIMSQVDTYVNETTNKIIMGEMGIDQYDVMVENIKQMGIDEATQINNTALERYEQRS